MHIFIIIRTKFDKITTFVWYWNTLLVLFYFLLSKNKLILRYEFYFKSFFVDTFSVDKCIKIGMRLRCKFAHFAFQFYMILHTCLASMYICTVGENIIATTKIRNELWCHPIIQISNIAIAILDFSLLPLVKL